MTKDDRDIMLNQINELKDELEVLEAQNKLYYKKCKICGELGCNILSLKHKGAVHKACLDKINL